MNKVCVLVCSGPIENLLKLQNEIISGAECIAVDGGFDYCIDMGIQPSLSIGDFDSTDTSVDQISYMSQRVVELPTDKDKTDFEEALDYLYESGYRNFKVYGGLGGPREDLHLSNLFVAINYVKKGCHFSFITSDGNSCLTFLKEGETINLSGDENKIVSIISFTEKANVSIKEMKYEYEGEIQQASSLTVSNRCVKGKKGFICCHSGVIGVFYSL